MYNVGRLAISPVLDGVSRVRADALLSATTRDVWSIHPSLEMGAAELTLQHGGFVVRSGERMIIVDTGLGAVSSKRYDCGYFLRSLEELNIDRSSITDVVLTHLHPDHIGWCSVEGEATFGRATYRCHTADLDHFVDGPSPDPYVLSKLAPILDRMEPIHGDASIAPGVSVRHTPGHTPGSLIVALSSEGKRAVLLGDVAHCPVELTSAEWACAYDLDKPQATAVRERLARELEDSDTLVAGAHFPGLQFGKLLRVGEARTFWSTGWWNGTGAESQ